MRVRNGNASMRSGPTYSGVYFGNSDYLHQCSGTGADATTKEENDKEGADVPRRDFTGLDCDGWTYDMFRPDEPYAARGTHPSGIGIDRYRGYSQLSPAEQRFTRKQFWMSLLNAADPNMRAVSLVSRQCTEITSARESRLSRSTLVTP